MENLLKRGWNYLCWPLAAFAIFACVQSVCMIPLGILEDNSEQSLPPYLLGLSLVVSNVATALIILFLPTFGLRSAFRHVGSKAGVSLLGVVGTLTGAMACNLLNELLSLEMPDSFENLFQTVSQSWLGIVAVGLLGPIAEEVVFRGGMIRPLLDRGASPWMALGVSTVLFGLAHGNLAQGFFAMLLGILLGVLYLRTNSLILCSLCHTLNNSSAVMLMLVYGEAANDMKVSDILYGSPTMWMILCGVVCVVCMLLFWKHTRRVITV